LALLCRADREVNARLLPVRFFPLEREVPFPDVILSTMEKTRFRLALGTPRREASSEADFAGNESVIGFAISVFNVSSTVKPLGAAVAMEPLNS
jgi:hypothetical protein